MYDTLIEFFQKVFHTFLQVWKFNLDSIVRYLQIIAHSGESFLRFIGRVPEVLTLVREYLLFMPSYLTTIVLVIVCISIVKMFLGR